MRERWQIPFRKKRMSVLKKAGCCGFSAQYFPVFPPAYDGEKMRYKYPAAQIY